MLGTRYELAMTRLIWFWGPDFLLFWASDDDFLWF